MTTCGRPLGYMRPPASLRVTRHSPRRHNALKNMLSDVQTESTVAAAQEENPATPAKVAGLWPGICAGVARIWRAITGGLRWVFGMLTVMVGLAVLSVIPVLNVLSLGYLLEVSGRVAR